MFDALLQGSRCFAATWLLLEDIWLWFIKAPLSDHQFRQDSKCHSVLVLKMTIVEGRLIISNGVCLMCDCQRDFSHLFSSVPRYISNSLFLSPPYLPCIFPPILLAPTDPMPPALRLPFSSFMLQIGATGCHDVRLVAKTPADRAVFYDDTVSYRWAPLSYSDLMSQLSALHLTMQVRAAVSLQGNAESDELMSPAHPPRTAHSDVTHLQESSLQPDKAVLHVCATSLLGTRFCLKIMA